MDLRRFLLVVTSVVVIILVLAAWFSPSNDDFRVENPFWNGTSEISALCSAQPLESLSDLPPSPQGVTLVLIPYLSCTTEELERLNSFIHGGGRLVLADDYGHGNDILEYLGLRARFSGQTLLDPLIFYKNRHLPRIIHLEPDPLTRNTESLILNHATCLVNVNKDDTLALSSMFSFLDRNDDGVWEEGEPTGPLPVISRHSLGRGEVILAADPSLFINGMGTIADNNSFILNLAATTTSLYVDQSHLPPSELHQTKNLLTVVRNFLATPWGTSGLVILALVPALKPVWHRKKRQNPG